MHPIKEFLLQNFKVGNKVKLLLNNSKEIEGEILSLDDDNYLTLKTIDISSKPVSYNIIGDIELLSAPSNKLDNQKENASNTSYIVPIAPENQIKTIISMFDDFNLSLKDIYKELKITGPIKRECNALIDSFFAARHAHEFAPKYNRISPIISSFGKLITENTEITGLQYLLCGIAFELLHSAQSIYINEINSIFFNAISKHNNNDSQLYIMLGKIAILSKKYTVIHKIIENNNKVENMAIINTLIFLLHSTGKKVLLNNDKDIYTEGNFTSLASQFREAFPKEILPAKGEITLNNQSDVKAEMLGGKYVSNRTGKTSETFNGGSLTGFIDHKAEGYEGLWVILALDGTTYTFLEKDVEDADIFKILRNPETWVNQSVNFYIEKGEKKTYAKQIQMGKIFNPRPAISKPIINRKYNNKPEIKSGSNQIPEINELKEADYYLNKRKDYKKALEFYKVGIEKAKKLDNSMAIIISLKNMVEIYFRVGTEEEQYENCLKAEKLLTDNKEYLQKNSYYTLLIQICEKLAKLGHEDKLLSALDEAIKETEAEKTSLYFILRKAYILQSKAQRGEYSDVVNTLNKWVTIAKNLEKAGKAFEMGKIENQRKTILIMAAGYIAKIRQNTPDYIIPSPLKEAIGNFREALQIMNTAPQEQDYSRESNIDQSWNILFDDTSYRISPFVKMKLDEINLTDSVRINMLNKEGNKFVGTVKEAILEFKSVADSRRVSGSEPLKRSEEYLRVGRIIYDSLQNEDTVINEDERQEALKCLYLSIGKSLVSFGDYAVKNHDFSLDTARYYYYEGLKYVINNKDAQDLQNAATRLNLSFFLNRNDIPLPSYDQSPAKTLSYSKIFPQLIENVLVKKEQIKEFINFVLQALSDEIFSQENLLDWMLYPIFISAIGQSVITGLKEIITDKTGVLFQGNMSKMDLSSMFIPLKKTYNKEKERFIASIDNFKKFSFSPIWLSEIKKISERIDKFRKFMLKCDIEYLDIMDKWVSRAAEYNDNNDCNTKAELLRFIISGTVMLKQKIKAVPSKLAFEIFYGLIPCFYEVAEKEYADLCENSPPEIKIELSGESDLRSNDGKVLLQINVSNSHGRITADSLTINVEDGTGFSVTKQDTGSVYIRGGDSRLFQIDLQLDSKEINLLEPRIIVKYKRKKTFTDETIEKLTQIYTLSLTNEPFKTIDNPYRKYAGGSKPVDDVKMFFGRQEFIEGITSQLISNGILLKQECILLYGQKRTGKSSILIHLKEQIKKLSPDTIIVDLKDISVNATESIGTIFPRLFCKQLKITLEADHAVLFNEMNRRNINIPEIDFNMAKPEARDRLNDFLVDFNYFIDSKPIGKEHNIVVMIDEFTAIYGWIREKRMDDDFMYFWKGFISNNKLVGILVGNDTMPDFIEKYANPFGAIRKHIVTYLPDSETERMITDPPANTKLSFKGDIGKKAIERIKELTAGSAFFNMILLDRLVQYMNEERRKDVSEADINKLCKEKMFSGISPMKLDSFEALYDDKDISDQFRIKHNLTILYGIAKSGSYNGNCKQNEIKIDENLQDDCLNNERIDSLITKLIARDVIERDSKENLKIKVGLFYEWLTQHCSPKKIKDVEL